MRAPVNDDYCVTRCYKLLLDDHTIPSQHETSGQRWAHFGPTFRAGWVGLIYTPSVKRGRFMSIIPDVLVYSIPLHGGLLCCGKQLQANRCT